MTKQTEESKQFLGELPEIPPLYLSTVRCILPNIPEQEDDEQ